MTERISATKTFNLVSKRFKNRHSDTKTSNHFILWSTLGRFLQFSRKLQSMGVMRATGGGGGAELWLVSRDTACRHPAPLLSLCSAGRPPAWAPARGTFSASLKRPGSRRAAGWTSCSPDPPGGPIRTWQLDIRFHSRLQDALHANAWRCSSWNSSPWGSWCPPAWSERRTCPWRTPHSTGSRSTERRSRPPGDRRWPAC